MSQDWKAPRRARVYDNVLDRLLVAATAGAISCTVAVVSRIVKDCQALGCRMFESCRGHSLHEASRERAIESEDVAVEGLANATG